MPTDTLHRLLLDNLTTAVILLNGELRLEYMNPAAEMLLAVSGQRSHGHHQRAVHRIAGSLELAAPGGGTGTSVHQA